MHRQLRYRKGERIGGRFLVHQALMGGMGEVYLCLDEHVSVPVQEVRPGIRVGHLKLDGLNPPYEK